MSDTDFEHRPAQPVAMFNPALGAQALSDAMASNAAKWRQINMPDQYNRGAYTPSFTGNALVDMGINMAGQAAYRRAGGVGTPRYMLPFTPGVNAMQNDMGGNYIGPMQQQLMQDFNRHTQPITETGLQLMSQLGYRQQAARLRQTMGQSSFMTDLAAMGNQSPMVEAIMGGNIFRGHQQLLNRAGSFQVGGPAMAVNPEMQMARSVAAVQSANAAGRAVVDMTYRDPGTGKFNIGGNTRYTGGWGGEDMQRLTAEMASRNVSQEMTLPEGTRMMAGMSNMRVDPYTKAAMVGRMGRATAALSSVTGESDPVEIMRMLQQNVGGGRASRNLDTLMKEATSLATIGGVAQMRGVDARSAFASHQGVRAGVDQRLSGMMDPSGNTPVLGTALGGAMARAATISAVAEAGVTGARTPQDMQDLTRKYGTQQLNRLMSNEGREVILASHAMEVSPGAAIFRQELEQSVQRGSTGRTREIVQQISEVAYGSSGAIGRTARNDRAFADSIKTSEAWERASGKSPESISDTAIGLLNNADKSEWALGKLMLETDTKRNYSRAMVRRMNLKVDPEALAGSKSQQIREMLKTSGKFSADELADISGQVGNAKGTEGLNKLRQAVHGYYDDSSKGNLRGQMKNAEASGELEYNKQLARDNNAGKSYAAKWVTHATDSMNAMTGGTPSEMAAHKKMMAHISGLDPTAQGAALEAYMGTKAFHKLDVVTDRTGKTVTGAKERVLKDQLEKYRKTAVDIKNGMGPGAPAPDEVLAKGGPVELRESKDKVLSAMELEINKKLGGTLAWRTWNNALNTDDVGAATSGAGGKKGGGKGENTVQEVILKEGTTFYIVDSDGKRKAMKTTSQGK